jgi:hypothetical protein
MPTVQDTYNSAPATGFPGMVANGETSNRISRTVENSAGLGFGKAAFVGSGDRGCTALRAAPTGAGSEPAGNVGTSTITDAPVVAVGTKPGRYVFVQIRTNAAGEVIGYDPDGLVIGDGVVGTEFTMGGITATITGGGTPTAGDRFYVDVVGPEFLGFCIADHGEVVLPGGVAADIIAQYRSAALMTSGAIYVTAQDDVTDRAPVYIDATTGGITDTVAGGIAAPGWIFDDTASAGAIVRVVRR